MNSTATDVLIIGGGQAGLASGYYLKKSGIPFIIVDNHSRVGDSWRNRYDSLVLFTPREYSGLPGLNFPGKRNEFPTKNETADYLENYAAAFNLPIQFNTTVSKLNKNNGFFQIWTNQGSFVAKKVIIATGPFQKERIPSFASKISSEVKQLHSSAYKNPEQLLSGETLVVGGGNSGAQIAVEISTRGKVSLSVGHRPVFLPLRFCGKSIFYWFDKLGILQAPAQSFIGRKIQSRPDPVFGLELKQLIKTATIDLMPKSIDASHNGIHFSDGSVREFSNIVWSTGFKADYSWLDLPHVLFDEKGYIIHKRGVTSENGLYIIGMPWQSRRTSALIGGVGEDARYIVNSIAQSTPDSLNSRMELML